MAENTRKIIQEFYKTHKIHKRGYKPLDREELYAYENKLGKSIFEMDRDELMGLIISLRRKRSNNTPISYNLYTEYISHFRELFQFYCEEYHVILNIFNSKNLWTYEDIIKKSTEKNPQKLPTKKYFEELMDSFETVETESEFVELVLWLVYSGLTIYDIIDLKEEMIIHSSRSIHFGGDRRDVPLSDRIYSLLLSNHMNRERGDGRYGYSYSWNGSYIRFQSRIGTESGFNAVPKTTLRTSIKQKVTFAEKKLMGYGVLMSEIHRLGFYDYLVSKYGEEETREIITNSCRTSTFNSEAKLYGGFNLRSITKIKRDMVSFLY